MLKHRVMDVIKAFACIAAGLESRSQFGERKRGVIMCCRGKRKGDRGAFLDGFKGKKLWREVGTTTDFTKVRAKGVSNCEWLSNS